MKIYALRFYWGRGVKLPDILCKPNTGPPQECKICSFMGSSVSLWAKYKPDHTAQAVVLMSNDNPRGGNLTEKKIAPQSILNFAQC